MTTASMHLILIWRLAKTDVGWQFGKNVDWTLYFIESATFQSDPSDKGSAKKV